MKFRCAGFEGARREAERKCASLLSFRSKKRKKKDDLIVVRRDAIETAKREARRAALEEAAKWLEDEGEMDYAAAIRKLAEQDKKGERE